MKLILASKSPRRREILGNVGVTPELLLLDTPEDGDRTAQTPAELVEGLACRKVSAAYAYRQAQNMTESCVLLSADTVVALNGTVLEKPKDREDASRMLHALSGNRHEVYTGVALMVEGKLVSEAVRTEVFFRPLTEQEITDYIATGEPMDKAGAYAVQLRGALFVEKIVGDFYNVVGLPVMSVDRLLKENFGFGLAACGR